MSSVLGIDRRRALIGSVGGLAVAAALFGAGYFTASALEGGDDDSDTPASTQGLEPRGTAPYISSAGPAADGGPQTGAATGEGSSGAPASPNIPASFPSEDAARSGGGSYGIGIAPQPFCQGDLPDVVSGSTIDLSLAGFDLNLLGDGYVLRSVSVRAEGVCDENGEPTGESVVVVDSGWQHVESGFEVYVSQRSSDEALPSVITPYNGQVWADGYFYTAWVNAYPVKPLDDVATDAVEGPDPRGEAVLRGALSALAPSVDERCYYVQAQGGWEDLADMGIGDPRPAIPGGLSEQYAEFVVFTAPPADCNAPALESGASFSASFGDSNGGRSVYVSAYPTGGGEAGYGYLDDGSAYWITENYGFNVSGYTANGPIGKDTIVAIATAMDPSFSTACFVTSRELGDSELAGLGFNAPVAPDGFEIIASNLRATEAPGNGCSTLPDAEYYPQYNLNWSLSGSETARIEASASRYPKSEGGPGYIGDGGLNWADANGTYYSVYGYLESGSGTVDRDTLVAVAQSMDPTLDVDSLQTDGGGVKPLPAAERSAR